MDNLCICREIFIIFNEISFGWKSDSKCVDTDLHVGGKGLSHVASLKDGMLLLDSSSPRS